METTDPQGLEQHPEQSRNLINIKENLENSKKNKN